MSCIRTSLQKSVLQRGSCPELVSRKVPVHPIMLVLNTNPWCLKWLCSPRPSSLWDTDHSSIFWGNAYRHSWETLQQARNTCTNLSWNWRLPKDIPRISRMSVDPQGSRLFSYTWEEYSASACEAALARVFSVHLLVPAVLPSKQLMGSRREHGEGTKAASQGGDESYRCSSLARLVLNAGLQRYWCFFPGAPFGLQLLQLLTSAHKVCT